METENQTSSASIRAHVIKRILEGIFSSCPCLKNDLEGEFYCSSGLEEGQKIEIMRFEICNPQRVKDYCVSNCESCIYFKQRNLG